ncbi:4Fe-4S dicluster domain-containing protein [Pluralibacter gergoviae]|uniref:4Fe-4S dicluster domain-containing protein n=1 Tax=Pluralibacter gergoviae TaxID=61647 RepID=UPI002FDA2D3A
MSSLIPALSDCPPEIIGQRVRQAGVVGAGGAGFPTYVKLAAKAEIYLVNAAECEPLLQVDQQLALREADALIRGLQYGMRATGAREGIIAIKGKHAAAIAALRARLPGGLRLHILPDVYPAGDEVITIWLATGRRVPPAALPLSVGVVVSNVQSLINVARAVEHEQPVTHRVLTVNGAVLRPQTLCVPVGTALREVLALAGGATVGNPAFINGGPMMGKLLHSLDEPVTKTTGGLLALPDDHLLIRRRRRSDRTEINQARTVCEQCGMCTEFCPRHMIGHELPPHLIVRAVAYEQISAPSAVAAALTCSECGVCEVWSCPVEISPMRINQMLKMKLRAAGIRYEGELRQADPMAQQRMVPIKRLVRRLDLGEFMHQAPMQETLYIPQQVTIPLRQHIGVPASPTVSVGERVSAGALIATVPDDALGAPVHASISGVVRLVDSAAITIEKE